MIKAKNQSTLSLTCSQSLFLLLSEFHKMLHEISIVCFTSENIAFAAKSNYYYANGVKILAFLWKYFWSPWLCPSFTHYITLHICTTTCMSLCIFDESNLHCIDTSIPLVPPLTIYLCKEYFPTQIMYKLINSQDDSDSIKRILSHARTWHWISVPKMPSSAFLSITST